MNEDDNVVGETGCRILSKISWHKLEILELSSCCIGVGVVHIAKSYMPMLSKLDISTHTTNSRQQHNINNKLNKIPVSLQTRPPKIPAPKYRSFKPRQKQHNIRKCIMVGDLEQSTFRFNINGVLIAI